MPITSGGVKDVRSPARRRRDRIELIEEGEQFVNDLECLGCHKVGGRGDTFAPDFSRIGDKVKPAWLIASRLKRKWIEKWLYNPQEIKSDTRMPRFVFKDWQLDALTAYLSRLNIISSCCGSSYQDFSTVIPLFEKEGEGRFDNVCMETDL